MTNNAGIRVEPRKLRALRFRKRLTQAEVAQAIGCSVSHYRDAEAGRVGLSLQLVAQLEALHGENIGGTWP